MEILILQIKQLFINYASFMGLVHNINGINLKRDFLLSVLKKIAML